jgi:hypothetical protein
MKNVVRSTIVLALAGGLAATALLLIGVDRTDLVRDGYLVFAAGLLSLAAARIAAGAFPAPRDVVRRVVRQPARRYAAPESLTALDDVVALAQADQYDLHFRLRPILVDIADAGLTAGHGADLGGRSARARSLLTAQTWELVRPERPRPERSARRGIETSSLAAILDELERILPP